ARGRVGPGSGRQPTNASRTGIRARRTDCQRLAVDRHYTVLRKTHKQGGMFSGMAEQQRVNGKYVGAPVRRVNDHKFITGRGQFVDDIELLNTLHVVFVRSPHAHARIRSIDASAALSSPGVVTVVTGNEITEWIQADRPHEALLPGRDLPR